MPKFLQDLNHIIDSSAVSLLSALGRVLFMQGNGFKARAMTFTASVCIGLVAGIITGNFSGLQLWGDIIVCVCALCAKEVIDWLAKKMNNPLSFFQELRTQKEKKNDDENHDNR